MLGICAAAVVAVECGVQVYFLRVLSFQFIYYFCLILFESKKFPQTYWQFNFFCANTEKFDCQ